MSAAFAGNLSSLQAWQLLESEPAALLIDVRTKAEWAYVGVPVLNSVGREPVLIEWQTFPTMERNPDFVRQAAEMVAQLGGDRTTPLLFLCRSGARSQAAAIAMTEQGFRNCYNVADGFEGPPDHDGHRGGVRGWKAAGLPWAQS